MVILLMLDREIRMNMFVKLLVACLICIGVVTGLVLLVQGMQ